MYRNFFVVPFCFFIICSGVLFAQKKKRLVQGSWAPNIVAEDIFGNTVDLQKLSVGNKVLVSFLRYATCPTCNYRLRELKMQYQALQVYKIIIIVFIESSKKNILDNLMGERFPYYIIADPENVFYNQYKVEKSTFTSLANYMSHPETRRLIKEGEKYVNKNVKRDGDLRRLEAEFLIGENLKILQAHYGKYIGDFLEVSALKNYTVKD